MWNWGGWMIFHFSIVHFHFIFCWWNFIVLFPYRIKYYYILFITVVFWLGIDRPSGLLLFVSSRFTFFHSHDSLLTLSVCFLVFTFAFPMRECLGKHSCMSSYFLIATLNGACSFARRNGPLFCRRFACQKLIKLNYVIIMTYSSAVRICLLANT